MTVLLDRRFESALDRLVQEWGSGEYRGAVIEAWLFEDEEPRRRAEGLLAEAGVKARIRSAYKPLVHAFLEEIDTAGLARVAIRYPVHEGADPIRFLSEAYPLPALLDGGEVAFETGGADLIYDVRCEYRDGRVADHAVFAPNRLRTNHIGQPSLACAGWIKATNLPDEAPDWDEPFETEIERVFQAAMHALTTHDWPQQEPYAATIAIDVTIAGIERSLGYGDEVMSTREALHEDLYFSTLEWFHHRAGRALDDRTLRPGQIVPDIRAGKGEARVHVALRAFASPRDPARPLQDMERADAAPGLPQIEQELAALPGECFQSISCEGRPVRGVYRAGSRAAVLVTSGQHANETSGPVGAFRAVRRLLANPDANVAFVPVENPDGYALHGRLCENNPRHMHHAARYTSLGNDLEYGGEEPIHEIGARRKALELSGAQLHVNLHGYPAHEWARPFTGYLPRGFEQWALPKGFFLILRYHPSWSDTARTFIEAVTRGLSAVPGLAEFTRRQLVLCALHSAAPPPEMINDVPCILMAQERHPTPLTLITEFPDETIYGAAYRFAHTVQMATVIAAEEAFSTIMDGMA
ncbi:M14 family zinc carboxypeptidase [Microvirga makkahensis]|uniref:Peptidase M14 n=1 Tax=Microvirga makkahensis TaxID=1128670 RepID=A0A7X3SMM6_9HYPH|nr:M14 family zinc carboxypeptidase [Microvirga makkahensis]MXQ10174.1 peptidase M14 [Microvirga makkahensis]